ncbi:histone-lysine N-methyltransferase SETMAR [Phytophthora cinnamomi]|uniref:histone-lysine N-methyltransferase SETMAR n=1 Tax=Phytophthora cinnamomi TaxID=4785 RepID=UPI003559CCD4|nr:histone-lysine N-methyltransferase SETMAR [Phytophthora cinnamomi]
MKNMNNKKKLRSGGGSAASLADVLAVVLAPQRVLWLDVESALSLLSVCRAARQALRAWLDAVVQDISQGKEVLPVLVQLPPSSSLHAQLRAVAELMAFTYTTVVQLPGAAGQYSLPADLLSKHQWSDERCRRVLRGRQVEVVVAEREGKGWGVLAAQRIERDEYVGEYTGELVSSREMRRRYRERYDPHATNYVLSLREHVARQGGASLDFDVVRTNVDASCRGSLTRFFNHSCAPSLEVAAVRVDSFVPRLAFFARRRVEEGDELTFDYGEGSTACSSSNSSSSEAVDGRVGHPCRCGALECRGRLPSSDDVS